MEDGERWTEIPPLNNLAEDKSTLLEGVVAAGMRHGFSLILNKVNSNCPRFNPACPRYYDYKKAEGRFTRDL